MSGIQVPAKRPAIVCASVLPCDDPALPCTQEQLLRRVARRGHPVLFVNPPLRWLAEYRMLRHDRAERARLWRWRDKPREIGPNFWVYTPPPTIPLNRATRQHHLAALLWLNRTVYRAGVRRAMARLGIRRPILWIALEPYLGAGLIGRLGERAMIYHCTDSLEDFGGYNAAIGPIEREVASRADLTISTAEPLRERMLRSNPRSVYLPNAADAALYGQALGELPEPADLAALTGPRAIYVGNLQERVDLALLQRVALDCPEMRFVFVGPATSAVRETMRGWGLDNVVLLGPKPQTIVPAYLKWCDVAMIPHKLNELTRNMFPLKLLEYLAAGKAVVSTPLEPILPLCDVVTVAATPETFARGLRAAAADRDPARRAARLAVARANDWEGRAAVVEDILARLVAPEHGNTRGVGAPVASGGTK